jgi:phosphoribosyl 1,2-cyclic phosphodiesterase
MKLFFTSLNSGSNGNCYFIGSENQGILIDAGLSCKETEKRLDNLDISIRCIQAIFISHEHIDHIKGLEVLSSKYSIPVYITSNTLSKSKLKIKNELINPLPFETEINIGGFIINAFSKLHDAVEPCSFTIKYNEYTIGVFTDIGKVCNKLIDHFIKCNAVFLESNFDDDMLENGKYPIHLKNRIKSDFGHLSNTQALELFKNHQSEKLEYLFLSHLSKENNHPEIVSELFNAHTKNTKIHIASRFNELPLFFAFKEHQSIIASKKVMQLSIF